MNSVFRTLLFSLPIIFSGVFYGCHNSSSEKLGCTDPRALNFDKKALYDNGECIYSDSYKYQMAEFWDEPDKKGNLLVINQTDQPVHLYADNDHLKTIPHGNQEFLLNVHTSINKSTNLEVWKVNDVDEKKNPPRGQAEPFRNWLHILQPYSPEIEPTIWVLNDHAQGEGTGKVLFNYSDSGNEVQYNVDIYLHNQTGAKLASIASGTMDLELRLDYGIFSFHYHYWLSDGSSSDGVESLGWISSNEVVLNNANKERVLDIPVFNPEPEVIAGLKVVNNSGQTVITQSAGNLIESIVLNPGNTQELSSIANNDTIIYYLKEDYYNISFINTQGQHVDAINLFEVFEGMTSRLEVGQNRSAIEVNNLTDYQLFLGDEDQFAGMSVDALSQKNVTLPSVIEEVTVFSVDSAFFKKIAIDSHKLNIE